MLRSVGSIIFGIAADRYGRKWPFVINNVLFIVLELVSCRCHFVMLSFRGAKMPRHYGLPDLAAKACIRRALGLQRRSSALAPHVLG